MKKTSSRSPRSPRSRHILSIALVGFLWLTVSPALATPFHDHFNSCYGVRGEAARQLRRIYETQYRSRNVYRSSRHADPWQNPYRSSRHYQRELALSHDGYIVRTIVHGDHGHHVPHSGLSPCLPPPCTYAACPFPRHLAHEHFDPVPPNEEIPPPPSLHQSSPPSKSTAQEPTQEPVLKQITLPGGRIKTIITSVPVEVPKKSTQPAA